MKSRPLCIRRASCLAALVCLLSSGLLAQQKPPVPTQQQLTQLDAALDSAPDIGHLFRANPGKIVQPTVIAKVPSLQTLFKQNPSLLVAIVRYKNAFQQREFRFAYGESATAAIPRTAVDWFDSYLVSNTTVAAALRKSPTAIDDPSVTSDPVLKSFLTTYPTFSETFKKHPSVFLFNPDYFKYYR
jgi:hypothetical protein